MSKRLSIGPTLKAARKQVGLTQLALAAKLGPQTSNQYVSNVECGNNHPGLAMIATWADACGVEVVIGKGEIRLADRLETICDIRREYPE